MKTRTILAAVVVLLFGRVALVATARAATVENVRAQQRPRSNIVDVFYDLVAPEGGVYDVSLAISGGGVEPPISTLSGDWGADVIPGRNKRIEWDAGADWAQHVQSNFVATVTATRSDVDTGPSKGMVRIPGGTNAGVDPDFGSYSLTVESFYMDRTEVTYAHWKRVYNWAVAHGYSFDHAGSGKGENHPVHTVNWYDCVKWCNARSEMEGRTPAYRVGGSVYRTGHGGLNGDLEGNGYRLPTATEWEYAARGGLHGRRFPWGDTITLNQAVYSTNEGFWRYKMGYRPSWDLGYDDRHNSPYLIGSVPFTAPVTSCGANRYGLYGMVGNVAEWIYSNSLLKCWYRGGGWNGSGYTTRIGVGDNLTYVDNPGSADLSYDYVGFRTVQRYR